MGAWWRWCSWADEGAAYYEDDDGCEENFAAYEDATTEYDEVLASYVEAKQKLAQPRVSRGYFPAVALVPEGAEDMVEKDLQRANMWRAKTRRSQSRCPDHLHDPKTVDMQP